MSIAGTGPGRGHAAGELAVAVDRGGAVIGTDVETHRRWARGARLHTTTLAVAAAIGVAGSLSAQIVSVDDPLRTYARLLEIGGLAPAGPSIVRPWSVDELSESLAHGAHPWAGRFRANTSTTTLRGIDVRSRLFLNTVRPWNENDGLVWQGKGLTGALDVRADLQWGALNVTLAPTLAVAQNRVFELTRGPSNETNEVAYAWHDIDLPQRFGADAYAQLHPGQSEIALSWGAARASFGTTNLWWGTRRPERDHPGWWSRWLSALLPREWSAGRCRFRTRRGTVDLGQALAVRLARRRPSRSRAFLHRCRLLFHAGRCRWTHARSRSRFPEVRRKRRPRG